MSFTAAQVLKRANTILQDTGAVRWTAIELRDWLNEAMRAVISVKPNAKNPYTPNKAACACTGVVLSPWM